MVDYAELHCLSHFSFLRAASAPEQLVQRAAGLGYRALALTDECSLAGIVRAHLAAQQHDLQLLVGAEFRLVDSTRFVLLVTDRDAYTRLCRLITLARRRAAKGRYVLHLEDLSQQDLRGCLVLYLPSRRCCAQRSSVQLQALKDIFPGRLWIAVELLFDGSNDLHLQRLQRLGQRSGVPLCASGDVHMHDPGRRKLQDLLTAIRMNRPLQQIPGAVFSNAQRYLRTLEQLRSIYPPDLLSRTVQIAAQCDFSLAELHYHYPREFVPEGYDMDQWLRHLTLRGAAERWPRAVPEKVERRIDAELELIRTLGYAAYFLTVHDIVSYARRRGILCQGRGSAANSVVCYCLGITEVDPERMDLLFERFISKERNEPPDIDVDFEHERREEVIQYIYSRYGRHRAALAASVISYRPRSAIRDTAKALGFSRQQCEQLLAAWQGWDGHSLHFDTDRLGVLNGSPALQRLCTLVPQLIGTPRHLSQHVGGFVIAAETLEQLVPVENAAMHERTLVQWDKDDLEALGLMKVDVLSLGMLSTIRKALALVSAYEGRELSMAQIPDQDPEVYRMIQEADTIGVFQIESRAQMSMLPRLKPRNYYDLVVQIAIVRPGPIQGDMVHPYLARRNGHHPVVYPGPAVEKILARTLGIPIFQEQVMQLAMVAAGFSAGEADQLRRSMAAWNRKGGLEGFEQKLLRGMVQRGYSESFARQIFQQIKGFGEYGFPESHAASFALLAYVSAWLKCHHAAAFTCALLNSQPMGFYAPAQLLQDARRHGVRVLPVDVLHSEYDCTLEDRRTLRLGLRLVKGLGRAAAERIVAGRKQRRFTSLQQLVSAAGTGRRDLRCLAEADALRSLCGNRHQAGWQVGGVEYQASLWDAQVSEQAAVMLPVPTEAQNLVRDYMSTGVSLRRHPLALLRDRLYAQHYLQAADLSRLGDGAAAGVAGLVINRQSPGTAGGVVFVTLEDESGYSNIIVWPAYAQAQRRPLCSARLLGVRGHLQKQQGVLYLVAGQLRDLSAWLGELPVRSRDFY